MSSFPADSADFLLLRVDGREWQGDRQVPLDRWLVSSAICLVSGGTYPPMIFSSCLAEIVGVVTSKVEWKAEKFT